MFATTRSEWVCDGETDAHLSGLQHQVRRPKTGFQGRCYTVEVAPGIRGFGVQSGRCLMGLMVM